MLLSGASLIYLAASIFILFFTDISS